MSDTPILTDPITLDKPIKRGEQTIEELRLRKFDSGEMRSLSLVDLAQLKVDALHAILPRITIPTITPQEAKALDPADLLALGAEVGGFLLQKRHRTDALAQ
ncbi:phage tail assembly protein [Sphingobium yanoikuyae]|uniref:phage tail assembly protein n=1 Tax=Sphingobium yanoikuyae TaxID=13690 RepID=UPI00289B63B2|nr:phage tail assembly protein [Sphingobium yanoikuyae]